MMPGGREKPSGNHMEGIAGHFTGTPAGPGHNMNRNTVVFIILLFTAFNLQGFYFEIGIKIEPADIVIVMGVIYFALYFFRGNAVRSFPSFLYISPVMAYFLFFLWCGTSAYISITPEGATTLYLQFARNFILLLLLAKIPLSMHDFRRINSAVFLIGVLFAIVSLMIYYMNQLKIHSILHDSDLWRGLGYGLDKSGYLRLSGLPGDANFFSLFMTLSLLCGIQTDMRKSVKYSGLLFVTASLILAFSRTIYFVILISSIIMVLLRLVRLDLRSLNTVLKAVIGASISFVTISFLLGINPFNVMRIRVFDIPSGPRTILWSVLYEKIFNNKIIFGYGLRTSQSALGHYSHNTYLETLVDSGVIGALLFMGIIFATFWVLINERKTPDVLRVMNPWNQMFIILVIFLLFFSFGTNSFFWVVIGMVISSYKLKGEGNEDGPAVNKLPGRNQ